MQIQELKLLNFRNYNQLSVQFDKHLNILYGENGSGKTNLIESIYVLALTRSFKQVNDKILIKNGTNLTRIEGIIQNKYKNTYRVVITNEGKKVKIDKTKITKISEYVSKINIVLFNPNDLKMIKDTPSIRRKYLNIAISQLHVDYLKLLGDYNKLLKIRNAYLKKMYLNGNSLQSYLQVLTEKLVDLGMEIYEQRRTYIEQMNGFITDIYEEITGKSNLYVKYISEYDHKSREDLLNLYHKNLKRDLLLGKTNIGIHHDDYVFLLEDFDLKDFGSEGQQKNAVISWKFSEISMLKENKGITPILILDDLLSELDLEKIKNILKFIEEDIQTFITTTEIEKLTSLLINKEYKKYHVVNGVLEEVI